MEMQESIVEAAGQIWNYLNSNGEVTTKKMQKDLSLDDNMTFMGIGWLSKEKKNKF